MAVEASTSATSSRSGTGGTSADSYIGSLISLTSKSEIRYEGILYNINTEESSIGLRNVRSFGTEGRKKDGPQVPPGDKIYEYILFRGSDIKDLQVKASPPPPPPPVQAAPSINSDPAIIQSHYPHQTTPPTSLPTAPTGSLTDHGSHSAQVGLPGSNFQSNLHLYQPGGNLNSWGPSPPNANGSGLAMPMYWQGFYGTPNGLPQLPQQSLLRPPAGLSVPPSMQQIQFPSYSSSLPTIASSSSNSISTLPDYHSSLLPNNASSSGSTSALLPAQTSSLNVPPLQPTSLGLETIVNPPNRGPNAIPMSSSGTSLPSLAHFPTSATDNAVANRPSATPGPAALPQQNTTHTKTSIPGASGSVPTEMLTPSLITPGQLLHSGSSTVTASQPLQTVQKDVEVVKVSSKPSSEPPVRVTGEAQPPILPLPPNSRAQRPNGGAYYMRNNYRGSGGRVAGVSHPVTKFTEDFDFMAMNEKFKKDEVWGHLGKSKSQPNDNGGNGSGSDEESQDEDDGELPKIEPIYNKDDFFDSISCNTMNHDPNNGRTRYSEQMKLDTETFGEFSRYRGGRGGRYPGRGGGRFRGGYYGRGYGRYSYGNRGRGRSTQHRSP